MFTRWVKRRNDQDKETYSSLHKTRMPKWILSTQEGYSVSFKCQCHTIALQVWLLWECWSPSNKSTWNCNNSICEPDLAYLESVAGFYLQCVYTVLSITANRRHICWFTEGNGQSEVFKLARIHSIRLKLVSFCSATLTNPLIITTV